MASASQPPGAGRRPTSALFVRIPTAEADKLDRASFELKAAKQDLVSGLVARYVDPGSREGLESLRELSTLAGSRRVTVETTDDSLTVGRHSFRPAEPGEVMTVEQLADFLQVDAEAVAEQAEAGELPARRIGGEWRFSRQAVLDWLGRPEPSESEGGD